MATDRIKIVIVEDNTFYGEILRKLVFHIVDKIATQGSISIVHHISAEDCLQSIDPQTDIFLLDYNLEDSESSEVINGLNLLKIIKRRCTNSRTVLVTGCCDYHIINQFFREGVDRYLLKDEDTLIRLSAIMRELLLEEAA